MEKLRALDLPEIRLCIARYLNIYDQVQCLQVCKAWHQTFAPFVWTEAMIVGNPAGEFLRGPSPEAIERHRDLVVHLRFEDHFDKCYALHYPKLQALWLHTTEGSACNLFRQAHHPTAVIAANPSLVDIALVKVEMPSGAHFWTAVGELPLLETMVMGMVSIADKTAVHAFWQACQKLEKLFMASVSMSGGGFDFDRLNFPRLETLALKRLVGVDVAEQLWMIVQCPFLKELCWEVEMKGINVFWEDYPSRFPNGAWPNLKSLQLGHNIQDSDVALALGGVWQAEELTLLGVYFGPLASKAIHRHFSTLRMVDLGVCFHADSSTMLQILVSCPLLEEFYAPVIFADDIVDAGPWACLSLVHLAVEIVFFDGEEDLQPQVFDRLSPLSRLRVLCPGGPPPFDEESRRIPLDFRLQSGLGVLSNLKGLRVLNFGATQQYLGEEEVRWMLTHWEALRVVAARVGSNGSGVNVSRMQAIFGIGDLTG
ncbi:hypothetical protein BGZ58_005453 [Dissophora ornata]|nr:hypothetical protein BGZ58_005453 [Dissophora ornata]